MVAAAFQSEAASSPRCSKEGNSVPDGPPPPLSPNVGAVSGRQSPTQPCSATTVGKEHSGRFGLPVNSCGCLESLLLQQSLLTVFILNIL